MCPAGAITEISRVIGKLETGLAGPIHFAHGVLNIGEAMCTPLIHQLKTEVASEGLSIIDSPPGTSCPVIESVRDTDLVLLVTEPTPFGLNDLKLAVEMVRALKLPLAVVINRADIGDTETKEYCRNEGVSILVEIPDNRRVAEAYSGGVLASESVPEFRRSIEALYARLFESNWKTSPTLAHGAAQ